MSVQGEVGNKFLTDDIIVKEALRLLKNELVATQLVHRDLERRFAKVGDVISLKKPYRTKTASGRVLQKQPLVDQTIPFKIDRQEHFGLEVTVRDRTLTIEQFSERYLRSGIIQIANVIDRSILEQFAKAYFSSSMAGSALAVQDIAMAGAYMDMVAVPGGQRKFLMNPLDSVPISKEIAGVYNPGMVRTAIQRGYMGPIADFDLFKSANMPVHKVGAWGGASSTPLTNGAGQTGDTLVTDGWDSGASTLNAGDVFTIAGVFEINPQSYESTGRLMRFVVQENVSDTTGAMAIKISPAINDGSLTTTDASGATVSLKAYQNVSAAPADNAAITVIGTESQTYRQNFAFTREAVALAMVDLELPQSAVVKSRVRDPDSGLSLTMTGAYDINEQTEITRIDAVWGVHMIYPHLAHRIFTVGQ